MCTKNFSESTRGIFLPQNREPKCHYRASLVTQWERICLTMQMWVQSLGQEDPLEKEMATHFSILAWENPMDRGVWQATVHKRARHNLATKYQCHCNYWQVFRCRGTLKRKTVDDEREETVSTRSVPPFSCCDPLSM